MRIFISTGEVSGDLQGSLLINALKNQAMISNLELEIVALGGAKMAASGAHILGDTTAIGSFGLLESLPFVLPTLQVQQKAIAYLKQYPPDLVVLIDYMGPNLGIGNYLRRHLPQVPVVYYIAPQVWVSSLAASDTDRVIAASDKILAIFPEEARYFQNNGADVTWVGHPLVDRMEEFPSRDVARARLGIADDGIAIALLPASRRQELKYLLPVMFQAARKIQEKLPQVHFWIPLSLEIYRKRIEKEIQNYGLQATVVSHQQQEVLAAADLAITKCGTVNLELGLLNVPQVVLYRLNSFTYWVGTKILKVTFPFASPVNLMVMKEIVPEFIQETATPENITQAAMELLLNQQRREQMQVNYQQMRSCMGELGVCDRAAKEILQIGNW
ncbi:MAG: lipid-A-disaccharide synthase [Nostocaceae cyanobacterium]|nr:lipid-A-disaccharide synthase [Nostocaceae cyanobacterium]